MLNGSLLTSVCLISLCRENAPSVSDPTTVLNQEHFDSLWGFETFAVPALIWFICFNL